MFESAMQFIMPIIGFLGQKYGTVGMVCGYVVLFCIPIVSLLIEILDFVVSLTPSKADDDFAAKLKAGWAKVMPVLEILPHANIPISASLQKAMLYIKKGFASLKAAVAKWKEPE